jgi:hypothetical protein
MFIANQSKKVKYAAATINEPTAKAIFIPVLTCPSCPAITPSTNAIVAPG